MLDAGSAGEGRRATDFLLDVWTRELIFFFLSFSYSAIIQPVSYIHTCSLCIFRISGCIPLGFLMGLVLKRSSGILIIEFFLTQPYHFTRWQTRLVVGGFGWK